MDKSHSNVSITLRNRLITVLHGYYYTLPNQMTPTKSLLNCHGTKQQFTLQHLDLHSNLTSGKKSPFSQDKTHNRGMVSPTF